MFSVSRVGLRALSHFHSSDHSRETFDRRKLTTYFGMDGRALSPSVGQKHTQHSEHKTHHNGVCSDLLFKSLNNKIKAEKYNPMIYMKK